MNLAAALLLCVSLLPCAAAKETNAEAPLRFSKHALSRMDERGVSPLQVREALEKGDCFPYEQHGRPERGCYDAETKVFVATGSDGAVITVIANATPKYIANLKKRRQKK